jgi:hypothetical protein
MNTREAFSTVIPDWNQMGRGIFGQSNYNRRVDYHDTPTTGSMASIPIDNFASFVFIPSNFKTVQIAPGGGDFIFIDASYFSQILPQPEPLLKNPESTEQQFRRHADAWYEEIRFEPTIARMTNKMNYLHILGLEPKSKVISLILKELKTKPAPWFLALQILTKNTGVGKSHAGNFRKIADDWVKWGVENHYL